MLLETSSVAKGGGLLPPPIGMQNMENTTFLALLNLISALEWKIAFPTLAFPGLGDDHYLFSH